MAKNRKNQPAAIRFGPALKALLLCLLLGGSGLGYAWQKNQITELGRQIARRELALRDLQEKNRKLADLLRTLGSPNRLDERVHELKLGLGPTQPGQVWRLPEPVLTPVVPTVPGEEKLALENTRTAAGL
jgi:hypothetical protein